MKTGRELLEVSQCALDKAHVTHWRKLVGVAQRLFSFILEGLGSVLVSGKVGTSGNVNGELVDSRCSVVCFHWVCVVLGDYLVA